MTKPRVRVTSRGEIEEAAPRFLYVRRDIGRGLTGFIMHGEPYNPMSANDWHGIVYGCRIQPYWKPQTLDALVAELLSLQASGGRLPPDIRPPAVQQRQGRL